MFFPDLLPDGQRKAYEALCAAMADFFHGCNRLLARAWEAAQAAAGKTGKEHHSSVMALSRHAIESLDGVAVLVGGGGGHASQPNLRAALEATLSVLFILQKDTERRAMSYIVAHAHKRIKLYNKLDPTTQSGQDFRKLLENDILGGFFDQLPLIIYPDKVANLQGMLARPEYKPIEAEWQRVKTGPPKLREDPAWHSLFNGPKSVREMAIRLNMAGMYELMYRFWSDEVHAGNALEAFARMDGEPVYRPVRHPELLQSVVQHGTSLALLLAQWLIETYAPESRAGLKAEYREKLKQRADELRGGRLINAAWKDAAA